ncbi:MAG: DnaJ-class molecular chaperone [Oleiphilaceae bacterium]|jgi:DnaJ-class molecular chaperone
MSIPKDKNKKKVPSDGFVSETLPVPLCPGCKGKGKVKPLFFELDCEQCQATGIDINDPIAIIKQQKGLLAEARKVIVRQRQKIYTLTVSEQQRTADSIAEFHGQSNKTD